MSLRGAMDGGKERGGPSERGKERGGGRARGGGSEGGTRNTVPVLVRTSTREGVKWMFYPVHISRARCCRDDAGLRVSHIYVVSSPPRRMRCTQSRVCEACGVRGRVVAGGGRWPWPRYGRGRRAAPRRGGGRADRGGPGLGREREMPDAARAAALSRRAYEAATGRGLGGVGTVSPVKRLGAWGLCGCGAGPVCALWRVGGRGARGGPGSAPRSAPR